LENIVNTHNEKQRAALIYPNYLTTNTTFVVVNPQNFSLYTNCTAKLLKDIIYKHEIILALTVFLLKRIKFENYGNFKQLKAQIKENKKHIRFPWLIYDLLKARQDKLPAVFKI